MTALKALVTTLAVLIAIALGAVVWRMVDLMSGGSGPKLGNVILNLPQGCRFVGAWSADGRLMIRSGGDDNDSGACDRVYVLDLETGAVLAEIAP